MADPGSFWKREGASLLLLAAMSVLAVVSWPAAPDRLPIHWNAQGQPDGYGGKFAGLLLLPLIAAGVYLFLTFLPRIDPRVENLARSAGAFAVIRTATVALFFILHGTTLLSIRGVRVDMNAILCLGLGALFLVLGLCMPRIESNWFVGIRTPWTLSSEESWRRTHQAGGKLMAATGMALMAIGVVRPQWGLGALLVLAAVNVVFVLIYSFTVWKRDPSRRTG